MHLTKTRRAALLALAALPLPLLVLGAPSAGAAEATGTVVFEDCEVTWNDEFSQPQRRSIGDLPISITIDHPTPIRTEQEQTVQVDLSDLPGDTFPMDLTQYAWLSVTLGIDDGAYGFDFSAEQSLGSFDASAPLPLGDLEQDGVRYADAGHYSWAVQSIWIQLSGDNDVDNGWYFFLDCDQVSDPQTILDVAVYDTNARAELVLDRLVARQGGAVLLTGRHLLSSAPTGNDAATVSIGGVTVGTLLIDDAGMLSGTVRVPEFAAPGNSQVRVTNGTKSATAPLQVKPVAAKVATDRAKVAKGKKITVSGERFKPGEKVKLSIKGGKGKGRKSFTTTVRAKAAGTFRAKVKLARAATGRWKVTASGATSKRTGKAGFRVS